MNNFWKHFFAVALAPIATSLATWAQNTVGGQHIPFTAGTILVPAIPVYIALLSQLFQKPPVAS